ncbi:ribonuclease PH [Leptotrichia sp. oral taxon 847]|mgnify:FL=1|uniref:ribonuclease PH n=1 Tax=Leptotrichia sp. oral taxon 847 TaxID=1785996 RepID=UPI0007681FB0|nr:ribonuclease PH [Leptotrichia sp. oral taxon 847]AMD94378.1 ribonuclease PH [Leptotrichia sp. oral taxon 847]
MRNNNRKNDEMREVKVTKNYIIHPEGSVLIEFGNTKVICNATIEEKIPRWLKMDNSSKGIHSGWITAEYSMLPRATNTRVQRESIKGKVSGRTMEIQRLIGRSLRAVIDLEKLGDRTIMVDCDVIQADGGTRTASITGAYLAVELAIEKLIDENKLKEIPIKSKVAAISVGKVRNELILDLDYDEDSAADVDMNIIMTDKGEFVEIQGTGEEATFTQDELLKFIELSKNAFNKLFTL